MVVLLNGEAYLANPYSKDSKCGQQPQPFLATCHLNNLKKFYKPTHHLEKCNITLLKELKYSKQVKKSGSGTLLLHITHLIEKLLNNTFENLDIEKTEEVMLNTVENELYITIQSTTSVNLSNFDITASIHRDSVIWLVPRAKEKPGYQLFLSVFHVYVWILILLAFFVEIWVWWLIMKYTERITIDTVSYIVIAIATVSLSKPVTQPPSSRSIKFNLLCYSLYCTIIWTIYQANLIEYLTNTQYEREITSTEDLINSKIWISDFQNSLCMFDNKLYHRVKHKIKMLEIEDRTEDIKRISTHHNVATYMSKTSFLIFSNSSNAVKVVDDTSLRSFETVFAMKKGHYFLNNFNIIFRRILEAGFISKLRKDLYRKNLKDTEYHPRVKLNLNHFLGAFIILVVGLLMATMIFMVERLCFLYYSNKFIM